MRARSEYVQLGKWENECVLHDESGSCRESIQKCGMYVYTCAWVHAAISTRDGPRRGRERIEKITNPLGVERLVAKDDKLGRVFWYNYTTVRAVDTTKAVHKRSHSGPGPRSDRGLEAVHVRTGGDDGAAPDGEHAGDANSGETVHAHSGTRIDVQDLALAAGGVQAGLIVVLVEAVETST